MEKAFAEFAQQNLVILDELSRRYAEYRFKIGQQFWHDLGRLIIREHCPAGYEFVDEKPNLSEAVEHYCGWRRAVDFHGTPTAANIAFGYDSRRPISEGVQGTSSGWPFMDNSCWTGVKMWVPDVRGFLNFSRQITSDTEPEDNWWLMWRYWEPLSAADLEGLHERLTGKEREVGQQEILEQLVQWRQDFEKILSRMQT